MERGRLGAFFTGLRLPDPAQEQRFQDARVAWLAPKLLLIAALIASLFLAFIPLDLIFAPEHAATLSATRIVTASLLLGIGFLARTRPALLPVTVATSLIAVVVYSGVFWTRFIVGLESEYHFTEATMLVQVGVWFLGGMTFYPAAAVNLAGLLALVAVELAVGVAPVYVGVSAVYLGALGIISGFAAWNIEGLFRRNFADNEELQAQRQEYRARSMRDGLTGLWNRRAMEERLEAARRRSVATGLHGAVLIVDLDRFKPINDRYGHQAGDDALIAVARAIQAVLRTGDSVGRTGGDEFLVLTEDLPNDQFAQELAMRIRTRIELPIRLRLHGDSATFEATVGASVGICLFSGETMPGEDIIHAADLDMYRDKAKRKGSAPLQR